LYIATKIRKISKTIKGKDVVLSNLILIAVKYFRKEKTFSKTSKIKLN
jgi:hypothetical protein